MEKVTMDKLRGLTEVNIKNNDDLTFQIIDWLSTDEEEDETSDNKYKDKKKYVIRAFGCTKDGTSVSLNIRNFPPHYYINVPDDYSKQDVDRIIMEIKSNIPKSFRSSITSYDVVKRKKFWYASQIFWYV